MLRNRVERAKERLQAAEMRVLEVAVACGCKTQQHFARVFRRVRGVSPTEYRHEFLSNRDVPLTEHTTKAPDSEDSSKVIESHFVLHQTNGSLLRLHTGYDVSVDCQSVVFRPLLAPPLAR